MVGPYYLIRSLTIIVLAWDLLQASGHQAVPLDGIITRRSTITDPEDHAMDDTLLPQGLSSKSLVKGTATQQNSSISTSKHIENSGTTLYSISSFSILGVEVKSISLTKSSSISLSQFTKSSSGTSYGSSTINSLSTWISSASLADASSNSASVITKTTSNTLYNISAVGIISVNSTLASFTEHSLSSNSEFTKLTSTIVYSSSTIKSLAAANNSTSLIDSHRYTIPSTYLGNTTSSTDYSSNHTSSTEGSFSFIIPYSTSQSCNIFGPTCQPGLITVNAVDKKDRTSLVTLPCSSYLASQSTYLYENRQRGDNLGINNGKPYYSLLPQGWVPQLLNSPECMSYRALYQKYLHKPWTFTECKEGNSVGVPRTATGDEKLPPQVPPAWFDGSESPIMFFSFCCDTNCLPLSLIGNVRLYYFQPEGVEDSCPSRGLPSVVSDQKTVSSPGSSKQSHERLEKRLVSAKPDVAGSVTAVVRGYTLTSPSIYLEFLGTMNAQPGCGPYPGLTSPILAVPATYLSTLSLSTFSVGQPIDRYVKTDANSDKSYAPLDLADIACSTFGVGKSPNGDLTVGPPWLPLFLPPRSMYPVNSSLNTVYTACSSFNILFNLYDPPIVLNPRENLIPSQTAAGEPTQTPNEPLQGLGHGPLQPGHTLAEPQPSSTVPPSPSGGAFGSQSQSTRPAQLPASEDGSYNNGQDAGFDGPENQAAETSALTQLGAGNANNENPDVGNGVQQGSGQESNPQRESPPVKGGQSPSVKQVNEPYNVNPDSNPTSASGANAPMPRLPVFAAGGYQFSADPSGFVVAGTSVSPGGSAADISGTPVSLGPSGKLVVGSQTMSLAASANNGGPLLVLDLADQAITPDPSGFVAAGKTVVPGGSPITIAGTAIALGPSNTLAVGSQTISLPPNVGNPAPPVLTVGDRIITPNPSGFVIAGTTIAPGGTPVTVSGTRISLDQSSHLVIGSQTISLPLTTPNGDAPQDLLTIAGQTIPPNPTGFAIAGTTVTPSGPPLTLSGTRISLGTAGQLVIGSSTISLPVTADPTSPAAGNDIITVAGQTITPNPTGFSIDGSAVVPGGSSIVVNGTTVDLGLDSVLHIGTSAVTLTGTSSTQAGDLAASALPSAVTISGAQGRESRIAVGLALALLLSVQSLVLVAL